MNWGDILLAMGSALLGALGAGFYLAVLRPRAKQTTALKSEVAKKVTAKSRPSLADQDAFNLLEHCRERIKPFQESRDILLPYIPEYGNTMHESGWARFITIIERIEDATETVATLIKESRPIDATQCAHLVLNQLPTEDASDLTKEYPKLAELGEWESECRSILRDLAQDLLTAAKNTQQLGIDRTHRRKATMQVSTELLRALRDL
jgi:hypothetical protein